ncbi:MAG TPA: hypothetical protein VFF52_23300 [Isosphaeraceae bacterium]|nr:hypothetical protein [Isosphaeraceae bacterium]
MRRRLTLIACLASIVSLAGASKAGSIMGTIVLTVAPNPIIEDGQGLGIPTAAVYSSGPVDLGTLPQGLALPGPALGFDGGLIGEPIKTAFDLKITFDGASGSQPSIDVTGSLVGMVEATQSPDTADSWFQSPPTSATVQGWSPNSGIPMALINQYLNTSNYQLFQIFAGSVPPDSDTFWLTVSPSTGATVPEPATVLLYLAAIAVPGAARRPSLAIVLRALSAGRASSPHDSSNA